MEFDEAPTLTFVLSEPHRLEWRTIKINDYYACGRIDLVNTDARGGQPASTAAWLPINDVIIGNPHLRVKINQVSTARAANCLEHSGSAAKRQFDRVLITSKGWCVVLQAGLVPLEIL
jgi:hypothetical protein